MPPIVLAVALAQAPLAVVLAVVLALAQAPLVVVLAVVLALAVARPLTYSFIF